MGIGADIIEFFYVKNAERSTNDQGEDLRIPKSIQDFLMAHPQHQKDRLIIAAYCHNFVGLGWLLKIDSIRRINPPFNERFFAGDFCKKEAEYGVYDFALTGFAGVYKHFAGAVRPVVVTKENGDSDIGSGFLVKNRYFVTAKHCIENMREVTINGWNPKKSRLESIWIPPEPRLDLAILEFQKKPFTGVIGFELKSPNVLEEVLTMGYPPVPGFDSFLVAETARVSYLKSSTGQIVGEQESYLDKHKYFLISARVKGGSSGCPVIGQDGKIRGVVVQLSKEEGTLDTLGYGIALPANHSFLRWMSFYDSLPAPKRRKKHESLSIIDESGNFVPISNLKQSLNFKETLEGFSTL